MSKPDRNSVLDFEPDYDGADAAHDDVVQAEYGEGADVEYEAGADPEYDDTVQADYDQVADPDYEEVAAEPTEEVMVVAEARPAVVGFAFEVGRPVVPLTQQQPHLVVWRGQLKERHPATGLVQRVPVYRLDDGYWDCYREEELQAA